MTTTGGPQFRSVCCPAMRLVSADRALELTWPHRGLARSSAAAAINSVRVPQRASRARGDEESGQRELNFCGNGSRPNQAPPARRRSNVFGGGVGEKKKPQPWPARKHFEEPSPESELAPWELVPSERVLAWVPQPGWGSSPECRWVPSRVDEHESRATFLIEQAGLPD